MPTDNQEYTLEVGEACERTDFGKWFCSRCRFGLSNFEVAGHRSQPTLRPPSKRRGQSQRTRNAARWGKTAAKVG